MHAPPIQLFVFPRMFAIPNLSPFCCKLETWLRIAKVPYALVETRDLAPTVLTPIETPIRELLIAQPKVLAYAQRMRGGFFPELAASPSSEGRPLAAPVCA
jgi:hypothetical protein